MTPHSKSPWTAMSPYIYSRDSNWPIAMIPTGQFSPEEQDANLRFITQASEMEEALVEMIAAFDKGHITAAQCVALGNAKNIIAKARGAPTASLPPAAKDIPQDQRHHITRPWAVGNILTCTRCGLVFYSVEESRASTCPAASGVRDNPGPNTPGKDKEGA